MMIWWALPVVFFLATLICWWNDIFYATIPLMRRLLLSLISSGTSGPSGGSSKIIQPLPPGYLGLPFLGEMPIFLWYFNIVRRPDDFINSKRKRYGDNVGLYRTYLFGCPSVIACSPSVIKTLFHWSGDEFKLEWPTKEVVGANSLIALEGAQHDRLRGFLMSAINRPRALQRAFGHARPRAANALRLWADMGRINAYEEIKKVCFVGMANYFSSFEFSVPDEIETLEKLCVGLSYGFRAQPSKIPGTTYHRALQCRKKLTMIFREELRKRLENKKKRSNPGNNTTAEDYDDDDDDGDEDLMGGLMKMKDEDGNRLTEDEVLDNMVSLLYTAYHSIAHLVTWALFYLHNYPHVLQKLREENLEIKEEKRGEFITYDDLPKLKYTNKVVEEVIRMGNLSAFVFRTATEDVQLHGYTIPKGWKVILWIRYLHTDPENFKDPMCFNPDRWNTHTKPGTYQVFGGGSRLCPGNMLVRLNLAVFLHHLAIGYKWELVNPNPKTKYLSHPIPEDGLEIKICAI